MSLGIPNSGYTGWIVAVGHYGGKGNVAIGITASVQAALFTIMTVLCVFLLIRVR